MVFEGIDLANGIANLGLCFAIDDGNSIKFSFEKPESYNVVKTAIDCPFGTSLGFSQLLGDDLPDHDSNDSYKSRQSELWLRESVRHGCCL